MTGRAQPRSRRCAPRAWPRWRAPGAQPRAPRAQLRTRGGRDQRGNTAPAEIVVTLSRRLVRRGNAGRVSGGPPPTSPATGWQVRPDAAARSPRKGHTGAARIWHWRAAGVTVVMRGIARYGGCPACTACGAFLVCGASRFRGEPAGIVSRHSAAGDSRGSDGTQGGHISAEPRINERIRVPEVRLVGPAGEQVGIVSIDDALRLAQEADLDLVEVAPTARPPVCKLMDYGKFKYESALKARESRKNQAQTVIKEIKLRPKIDPHDYGTKKGHVERFLKAGDKVKVTIMFRGREQSRPELGFRLLQRLAGDVEELGFVESSAQAGRPEHDHGDRPAPPEERGQGRACSAGRSRCTGRPCSAARPRLAQPGRARRARPGGPGGPACAEPSRLRLRRASQPSRPGLRRASQLGRPGLRRASQLGRPRPAPSQPARAPRPAPSQPARAQPASTAEPASSASQPAQQPAGPASQHGRASQPAGPASSAARGACARRPAGSRPARRGRRVRDPAGQRRAAGNQAARSGSLDQLTASLLNV